MVIKRVGPLSCAKIAGTLYAAIGLLFGAILSTIALAGGFSSTASNGTAVGSMLGHGAIVVMPLFYGCIGFVGSLIVAALYNIVANVVGGVEVDLE